MEETIRSVEHPRDFRRAEEGRLLGGVCGGVADYFDLDVVLVRVVMAVLAIVGGVGVPLYLAAWLLVPEEGADESIAERLLHDLHGDGRWAQTVRHASGGDRSDVQTS